MDEKSGSLDLEESLDDFMAMFTAGTATTNATLMWSLAQLTRDPPVMGKLVAEVTRIDITNHSFKRVLNFS